MLPQWKAMQQEHPPFHHDDDDVRAPREEHKVKVNLTHRETAMTKSDPHARETRSTQHIWSSAEESETEDRKHRSPSAQGATKQLTYQLSEKKRISLQSRLAGNDVAPPPKEQPAAAARKPTPSSSRTRTP